MICASFCILSLLHCKRKMGSATTEAVDASAGPERADTSMLSKLEMSKIELLRLTASAYFSIFVSFQVWLVFRLARAD
jgi:hypothetical protein